MDIFEDNGQLWTTSLEIADMLGIKHFILLRDIRIAEEKFKRKCENNNCILKKSIYTDAKGAKRPMYILNEEFYNFIIEKYSFNRVVRYGEDLIKNLLEGTFLDNVKYQYKILNYRVDFYIPYLDLIIEYDEEQHEKQIEEDKKRMNEILEELKRQTIEEGNLFLINKPANEITKVMRVKIGEEFTIINRIINYYSEYVMLDVITVPEKDTII